MENNTQLICALQMTLSGDKENRVKAENYFDSMESNSLFSISLINISCDQKFPKDLRLSASILVKNYVKKYWRNGEIIDKTYFLEKLEQNHIKKISIPQKEKDFIRSNIFQIIIDSNDNQIR